MRRCIAAWTARTHPFPEYISVNQEDDGTVEVTVRHQFRVCDPTPEYPEGFPVPGPTSATRMSAEVFSDLLRDCLRNFRT